MDNDFLTPSPETTEETASVNLEKADNSSNSPAPADVQPSDTQPAFDYQPPTVKAPEPPTVSEMPVQPETVSEPVASATQSQYQQPQYQQPQYQQPQYQQQQYQQPQYQQPQYQQPQYQQPQYQQQQYQQPQYQQQQYQQTAFNQQPYYQYAPVDPTLAANQNTSDGFAIASLICSIIGLVSCCTVLPSLLGVIFGAVSKVKNDGTRPTGVSTVGLIIGIIGLIINLLIVIGMIFYNN